jgi:hypothetical protein
VDLPLSADVVGASWIWELRRSLSQRLVGIAL